MKDRRPTPLLCKPAKPGQPWCSKGPCLPAAAGCKQAAHAHEGARRRLAWKGCGWVRRLMLRTRQLPPLHSLSWPSVPSSALSSSCSVRGEWNILRESVLVSDCWCLHPPSPPWDRHWLGHSAGARLESAGRACMHSALRAKGAGIPRLAEQHSSGPKRHPPAGLRQRCCSIHKGRL